MYKKIFLRLTSMILLISSVGIAQAVVIVNVVPSASKVDIGEQLDVDIVVSGGLEGNEALGAFDLRLVYNPNLLGFTDLVFGDQLDLFGLGSITGFSEDPSPAVGAVSIFEVSLDSITDLETLQEDSFTLVTLSFIGLSPGLSPLHLPASDIVLSNARGVEIPAVAHSALVHVPEPATIALFTLGLIGVGFTKRSKRSY